MCNVNNSMEISEDLKRVRKTPPILTKYERANIIGRRAQEISEGAPVCIELTDETDAVVIAQKEFKQKKIKGTIVRIHADGTKEPWRIEELYDLTEDWYPDADKKIAFNTNQ